MSHHIPVLAEESIKYLVTDLSGVYFDGTIGFGGHSSEFLKHLDLKANLIATDKDLNAFNYCKKKFDNEPRIKLYHTSFTNIDVISRIENIVGYNGIFADLGVSSYQYDEADAGFTYRSDAELDLRMDKSEGRPAWQILNELDIDELKEIFWKFGEEKRSRLIAQKIIEFRKKTKITRTGELREIVESCVPYKLRMSSLSKIFQALRIYVNNELDELEIFLERSLSLLSAGGRIGIISYHSLEDRIVKNKFRYESLDCICPPESPVCSCSKRAQVNILTKKPISPGEKEIHENKRSRSAKLRIAEKI